MNTINNQFAKVFDFPDGQLLLMLQYDVHSVASTKPEMTYLVMVTEWEDSVAEIKRRYFNIYEARDVLAAYPEHQARVDYEFWQKRLKEANTDIRLNMPANEKSGHGNSNAKGPATYGRVEEDVYSSEDDLINARREVKT